METKLVVKDEFLWNRILGFSLDAPGMQTFRFRKSLQKKKTGLLNLQKQQLKNIKNLFISAVFFLMALHRVKLSTRCGICI